MRVWNELDALVVNDELCVAQILSGHIEELLCWLQIKLGEGYGALDAERVLDDFCEKHIAAMLGSYANAKGGLGHYCRQRLIWCCGSYRNRHKATAASCGCFDGIETSATAETDFNFLELTALIKHTLELLPPQDALILQLYYQ